MMVARVVGSGVSSPQRLFDLPPHQWEFNRSSFAVYDHGRRFLVNVQVPLTAPQVITVGQNWTAGLGGRR